MAFYIIFIHISVSILAPFSAVALYHCHHHVSLPVHSIVFVVVSLMTVRSSS
jgi:hypothetical protein